MCPALSAPQDAYGLPRYRVHVENWSWFQSLWSLLGLCVMHHGDPEVGTGIDIFHALLPFPCILFLHPFAIIIIALGGNLYTKELLCV